MGGAAIVEQTRPCSTVRTTELEKRRVLAASVGQQPCMGSNMSCIETKRQHLRAVNDSVACLEE